MPVDSRKKLADIRKSRGMGYRELSMATGGIVSPGAIELFEMGIWDMPITALGKLLDVLGVSFDDFCAEEVLN